MHEISAPTASPEKAEPSTTAMKKLEVLRPHSVGKRIAARAVSGTLREQQQRIDAAKQASHNQLRTRQKDFSRPSNDITFFAGVSKETRFIDTYTARLRPANLTLLFECPVDWQLVDDLDPSEEQAGNWRAHVRNLQAWVSGSEYNETAEQVELKMHTNQMTQVVHKVLFAGTLKCIEYDDPALQTAWTGGNKHNRADSMALRVQESPLSVIAVFLGEEWTMEQTAQLFKQEPSLPLLGAIMSSNWHSKNLEEASQYLEDVEKPYEGEPGALAQLLRHLSHHGLIEINQGLADSLYLSRPKKLTPEKKPDMASTQ